MASPDNLPEITLKSWDEFDSIVKRNTYRKWVYRGQTDSTWAINSSLNRLTTETEQLLREQKARRKVVQHLKHEKLLIEKFQSHAHLYSQYLPDKEEPLEWLSVMQHFGAPTRLIDVTFSPYIALYFALEAGVSDASVYVIRPDYYRQVDEENLEIDVRSSKVFNYEKEDGSFFVAYEPLLSNVRLSAQQGLFLVPSKISTPFKDILEEYTHDDNKFYRIIIPSSMRIEGVNRLKKMNVTASVLFPGIDGFCRSLRTQVSVPAISLQRMS